MPGYGMKKKPMKHGGKVHRNKKGHGGHDGHQDCKR